MSGRGIAAKGGIIEAATMPACPRKRPPAENGQRARTQREMPAPALTAFGLQLKQSQLSAQAWILVGGKGALACSKSRQCALMRQQAGRGAKDAPALPVSFRTVLKHTLRLTSLATRSPGLPGVKVVASRKVVGSARIRRLNIRARAVVVWKGGRSRGAQVATGWPVTS
jgi:hypothetical protein